MHCQQQLEFLGCLRARHSVIQHEQQQGKLLGAEVSSESLQSCSKADSPGNSSSISGPSLALSAVIITATMVVLSPYGMDYLRENCSMLQLGHRTVLQATVHFNGQGLIISFYCYVTAAV